jgi:hypothetical protein
MAEGCGWRIRQVLQSRCRLYDDVISLTSAGPRSVDIEPSTIGLRATPQ